MRTIKECFYDIVKLFINQLGITIFALFLYTAVGTAFAENDDLFNISRIVVSAFSIVFYIFIVYYMFWEIGAKDGIRINGGRMEKRPFKGIFIALWANTPNFIVAFLSLIFLLIYKLTESEGILTAFRVSFLIETWMLDMYLGLVQGITPAPDPTLAFDFLPYFLQSLLYIVAPLVFSVLTVHFSYTLGLKDKKLFSRSGKPS